MVQIELGWLIGTATAIVGALWGLVWWLLRLIDKLHEAQHNSDLEQITYLRNLLTRTTALGQEGVSMGHEAVDLASRTRTRRS